MMTLSKSALWTLSLILLHSSANAQSNAPQAYEAAAAESIIELIDAGIITVHPETGAIVIKDSILEILKKTGLATEKGHSDISARGCGATEGGESFSPRQ